MASRLGQFAVVALTLATGLVLPTSAAAAPGERVFMYEDPGYSGSTYVVYDVGQAPNDKVNIDGWNGDNETSSLTNWTGRWVILFDNDNYTGTRRCISPTTTSVYNLSQIGFDNRAESFQLTTSTMC